jgi:hypothetical protein
MDRSAEKERLREVRLAKEEEAKRRQARLARPYAVAAVLAIALVVVGVVLVMGAGNDSSSADGPAFGPHYEGLEERRLAAGVPTMAEGGGSHFHPLLAVYANGKPVTVPANIGIDPTRPPTEMAGLHTHDVTGTIHNEAGSGATLGDFFAVWGVPFSGKRLGPYRAGAGKVVRMWVDGAPSQSFGRLSLEDEQRIVIAFGPPSDPAPPLDE